MNRVAVEPRLLRWARHRSGKSAETLQRRFPRLSEWERGESLPTFRQLENFANATYTPIGYLFLAQPPVEEIPLPDFRTVGGVAVGRPTPDLLDTIHICQQRQTWYRDEAQSAGEPPLDFVGSLDPSVDPALAGRRMRKALGSDGMPRPPTWADALRRFIERAETLGILVMVSGVVGGNTHRRLDPEEFRGFALADRWAPLVFINGADTKAAQMFTLAHELAHLWLGESGVSNAEAARVPAGAVERWCNLAAAELLLPAHLVREVYDDGAALMAETGRLARLFKVSTLVVLRRIHDLGMLGRAEFRSAYQKELERLGSLPGSRGGNAIRNVGARVSKRLARALVVSTLEGRTSYTEAFRLLGVKQLATFERVAESLGIDV